ncbi:MAG: hypothetical protein FK730_03090 [Asgard group archaeon]|nr:hypothetical protein [Asgard group archaeon]
MIKLANPIEGFFIKSKDNLIFDVKGLTHPNDRTIAFVRYVPYNLVYKGKSKKESYQKIYALSERYQFLSQNFPKYLFNDPQGRGILQAVHSDDLLHVYNPISGLQELLNKKKTKQIPIENQAIELVNQIVNHSDIQSDVIGLTGSLLVKLHKKDSDIDLVIYGKSSCREIYNSMHGIFDSSSRIKRYTKKELRKLWKNRGQSKQIDFNTFLLLEKGKNLQGTIDGRDFYIRLVQLPSDFNEPYNETKIKSMGSIEITATVKNNNNSIFTPCLYQLEDVDIKNKETKEKISLNRIFSLRGRYCELAEKGERVHVKGKLEKISIKKQIEFHQLVLGSIPNEFFKKTQ